MKITLLVIGKTSEDYLLKGIAEYEKRLTRYTQFSLDVIADVKNASALSEPELKEREGKLILEKISQGDKLILLDYRGTMHTSPEFARFIEKQQLQSVKRLVFVVGGAYGFSEAVYKAASGKISLSPMTFSHQMVRLIFVEQLYRAMTILKGEPYHHE
jgi:23S rRNA (pseudouridine1915-N3)-methyltransferase